MAAPQILPFVTEAAYAQWAGAPQRVLCEAEVVEGPGPFVFPRAEPDFYGHEPLSYDFPPITVTTLRDALVRGRSNVLTPPEAIVRHDLIDPEVDVTPEEFYGRLALVPGGAAWAPADPFNVDYLPQAAAFTDGISFNYAHWMTEVLPRIAVFARDKASAGVPLIVDSELHPNIARSIALVAGPDAPIYRLAPDRLVRVGELLNVSSVGYVPFKLRPGAPRRPTHGLFASEPLRETVRRLRAAVGGESAGPDRPKLLVRRSADLRNIVNQAEVDAALEARGFTTVDPGALSLEEQVRLYSGAGMVVGGTGAAIANLIFCQPQCATIVMIPRLPHVAFWYWRRIGAAAGAGPVVHVVGEQIDQNIDPFDPQAAHKDFRIEVKDVLEAVDKAEGFSG